MISFAEKSSRFLAHLLAVGVLLLGLGNRIVGNVANHSVFIKADGSLHAMGFNSEGQLGNGTTLDQHSPVQVVASGVVQVAAGNGHSLFLKSDGSLHAMGSNTNGQLGIGNTTQKNAPTQVVDSGVVQVAAGGYHSLFLKSDGSLHVMGRNDKGQLGIGNTTDKTSFLQVVDSGVVQIGAGKYHSLFLKSDGSLYAMGLNNYGQLGTGNTIDQNSPVQVVASGVTQVVAGHYDSVFIKSNGSLWAMGRNDYGQLGDGTNDTRTSPVQVVASGVTQVVTGYKHNLFLKSNGSLWAMGNNFHGMLGDGTTTNRHSPVQVVASEVVQAAAGYDHSLFLKSDGSLWAMGDNGNGQLGDGSTTKRNSPVQVATGVLRLSEIMPPDPNSDSDNDGFTYAQETAAGNNAFSLTITVTDGEASATQVITVNITDDPADNPIDLTSGLVAWYPFDGNASDMSGNGNDGTVHGATPGTDRNGQVGKTYDFDGVDDYISSGEISGTLTNKTLSAWVKLATINQGDGGLVTVQKLNGIPFDSIVFNEVGGSNLDWQAGSEYGDRSFGTNISESADIWRQVIITYESQNFKIYRNGDLIGTSQNYNTYSFSNSFQILVGKRHTGANNPFLNATIDDVRIYNRALSAVEVAALYQLENTPPNQPPVFAENNATFTTAENNASASFVVTATDPDANTTLVYSSSGPDAGKFTLNVVTGTLTFTNTPDFEANASAAGNNAFSLTITVTDGEANATQAITVNVTNMVEDLDGDGIEDHADPDDDGDGFSDADEIAYGSDPRNENSVANQAPTAIDLNGSTVAENQPSGTIVGKLTGVDPDGNATLAFSRANGQGSKHNNQFFVGPHNNLKTKAPIDFEANATLKVRLKVTDEHNASIEQTFVITVLDDPTDNNTSVVDANGTFVDTNASLSDNNATVPDSNGTYVDTNATVPDGNGTFVDTNATSPDNNGTIPDQNGTFVDTNATFPDQNGTHVDDNAIVVDANGTLVDTNGTYVDDNATLPDSNTTVPDPNTTPPDQNETMVEPDEPHTDGNGTVPDQNGTLVDHNQTHVDTNGTAQDANTTVPDDNATILDANEPVVDTNETIVPPPVPTYRPIARTLRAEIDAEGRLTLNGVMLTDGGETVSEVGFILSNSLFGELHSPGAIIVGGTLSGDAFTASAGMPDLGKRFYYRAYATNAKGTNLGSPKRFVVPEPVLPAAWWASAEEATAGWRISSWFGAFRPYENGWIFHADLDWLYVQSDGVDGLWVWSKGKGWLWTNPGSYRYLYQANTHQWLYFLKRKDGQPRFYNHATGAVE